VSAAAAAAALGAGALGFGTVGAAVGSSDASEWKATYGVPEDFVTQVGGMVQPGTSALFATIRSETDPVAIARRFAGYGGTVLRTSLTPAKAAQVQETIAASRETRV
jgi:uncharacterized membrane protein